MSSSIQLNKMIKGEPTPKGIGKEFGKNFGKMLAVVALVAGVAALCMFAPQVVAIGVIGGLIGIGLMGKISYDSSKKNQVIDVAKDLLKKEESKYFFQRGPLGLIFG